MDLAYRIADLNRGQFGKRKRRWTFTLEPGRGQTYASGDPTLYAHNVYPRGSVLSGRPERVFLEAWDSWPDSEGAWDKARAELDALKAQVPGFKYDDFGPEGGSTHIDVDTLTAGLPDDEG
jgi:hypothetical protein